MLNSRISALIRHLSLSMLASILICTNAVSQPIDFAPSGLQGVSLSNPTSLQFGPDDRLYVSQQNGVIKAFTVQRNGPNDYQATSTETIDLVQNIPNHNDDGTPAPGQNNRLVTGIYVTGTDTNPVLYVGSSDPRIGAGGGGSDLGLDTNSGVISKLTCPGGVSGNSCQGGWDMVHLVRGLPRSEENHATNGLQLDAADNVLLVAQGGHANAGAPSNNFAFTTEYALSAAVLEIDLAAIEAMETKTDAGQAYKYDLPTLDDPTRPGSTDAGDPFGGNNGLNMAKVVENGPVQIYSPGYRNAYDLVLTEDGKLYVVDNGPNGGWGGYPQFEESNACTNQYLPGEPGSSGPGPDPANYFSDPAYPADAVLLAGSDGNPDLKVNNWDNLHYVPNKGYYAGHPNPIRANPAGAGLYTRDGSGGSGVFRDGSDTNNPLPPDWPAVPLTLANPVECDYRQPGVDDGALTTWDRSTNGITEYTASNFGGALQGNLLTAAFKANGPIDRIELNAAGDGVTNVSDFASGFGSLPLDVTAQGDDDPFGGTVWAATYGANNITIFEPTDYDGGTAGACTGAYDDIIDEDGDEYSNADEIDNGTDPCSAASKPEDFDGAVAGDGFKDSNLNDPDDDDDGKPDTSDPFPIDADNGTTTTLPVQRELFNSTGFGFGGIGFTGLMTNGTDYLDLLDPDDDLILGGTSGLFTNPSVGEGDAFEEENLQVNALQFGVDVDQNTAPFTVEAQINGPFSGISGNYASQGIYIGTGDQENYLKVVLNDLQGNDSGFQVLLEEDGDAATGDGNQQVAIGGGLMSATNIVLFLSVDPAAGTVQAKYSADAGPVNDIGNPVSIPADVADDWLSSSDDQGLAVGFIATSFGNSSEFAATWDYINVTLDNQPPVVDPIADQTHAEGDNISNAGLAVSATDPDTGPDNLTYSISGQPSGVGIEPTNGQITGAIDAGAASGSPYAVTITVDDGADSTQINFTWNVISASGGGTLTDAQFQQVALPVTDGGFYTSVAVGPDDKLYAMNINADIHRWSINADGTLANDEQVLTTINDVEANGRSAIGLVFDPAATAGNLIAWVTHVDGTTGNGDQFSGKITRLSGANLETAQDFVTGLPRSSGDHLVNSLAFGPDSALYVNVGSLSAMGAFDGTWQREETLLSAATLRVDLGAITSPPLDVQTEAGGSYDPFASGAQVTVFGQGVRNAYDLVWHSNGFLYVPTNGSAPGNTPASDAADICPDGLNYAGPPVPALNGVSEQPDFLFKVEEGGYYGHPNPTLCNYVLNGGNPTAGSDLNEVSEYPVGTDTDADYVAADSALDFAVFGQADSHSPNGVLEYQSNTFDGGLQGALLVARFHYSDIVAIRPDMSSGDIIETSSAIPGLGGLSNPLDVTEDSRNGNLYVSETVGAFTITLLRPLGAGVPNIDADQDELIYSGVQGTVGEVQSLAVTNNGTADLDLTSVALAGSNAADFAISADPAPVTLQPGEQATVDVQFTPGNGVTGALSALLQINSNDADEPTLEVALFGLSAQGLEGNNEPPLQQVVDTLGYAIDVGGTALGLGTDPAPIGDEVAVSLFRKSAGDSPVTIEPVARYSPDWVLPFGWYQPDGATPILNQVGELSGASSPPEHQTLFPQQISGSMSFDPGSQVFGLYTTSPSHTAFTEDALNNGVGIEPHSARVYPLADRNGNAVPNSFLVAFEEASNGDYQDYVFVIRNALPAQPVGSGCAPISPLDCPQVPVNLPYNLNWDADEGGVGDAGDVGTGFTMVDPPSNGTGYLPANLAVNTAVSTLDIMTTAGIQFGPTSTNPNSLDNGLGVAFDADVQTSLMETTLVGLPPAPGDFAQAGLWLFLDESHYVKLVALSRDTNGWEIQLNYEQDNLTVTELESGDDVAAGGDDVSLALDIDPVTNQVTGLYSINGGAEQMLGPIDVDPSLLAGNLLPEGSGPLSFGGIFATQRNAAQQVFSFDDFALSLTGTAANLPPLVSSPGNQIGLEGDVVSLQISATDPDGDDSALSYSATGLPTGLSIDASGLISGTIAAGAADSSPYNVTVSVSDAEDTTDVSFDWNVGVPGDINSGLLLHWPFDETGGLVATDISGNNNDGAVSASGATFVAGQLGNAIQLDGVAGFVADDDAENYLNGLEQITVTTWVKADTTPTDEGIFTTANPDNKDEFLAMRYDAAGFEGGGTAVIKGAVGNGEPSGNFSVLETSSNVQSTDWQHLALVWNLGAPAEIYIDGVLNTPSDVTGTMAAALNAVDRLWVGRASKFNNGESGWAGLIDDFRIYGRVLTAGEILQLASGNTPPAAAAIQLTPNDFDFGQLLVGDSLTQSFVVSNSGGSASTLAINTIDLNGADFGVIGGDCVAGTTTLSGGDSCSVEVQFAPAAEGAVSGSLDVASDAGNVSATLDGEGLAAANLQITPASEDFGSVLITETTTSSFSLSNTGDPATTITLDAPALAAGTDTEFSISGGDCAASTELIGGGAACTVEITFDPTALNGPFTGTLEVGSDANAVTATLSGVSELPDWEDGFGSTEPGSNGFEQDWTFLGFDDTLSPIMPTTAAVTNDYLQIRDPNAIFAVGYVERTFNDTRTSALVNADGSGDSGLDNQIDQGVIARFDPDNTSGYAAYMRMELNAQELVLIKFDASNLTPALVDIREEVATSTDPDWDMGRQFVTELDLVDQDDGSVLVVARALDAASGAVLSRLEFIDPSIDAFTTGFSGVVAISNSTGLNGIFDTTAAVSAFASADLAPDSIDFGAVETGVTDQQTVTLTNNGNDALVISDITIGGASAGDYMLLNDTCLSASPLPAGNNCTFDIAFTAGDTGQRSAEVLIDSSASTSPDIVLLDASVFASELALTPLVQGFGAVLVGASSSPITFTVSNAGDTVTELALSSIATTGEFNIVAGGSCTDTTVLDGGDTCTVDVEFAPNSVGMLTGTLDIGSDAGIVSAALSGDGLAAAALVINPTSFDFEGVSVGETATTSFTLSNTGDTTSSLDLSSIAVSGAGFSVTGGSCTATTTLSGGDSCSVEVQFAPAAEGAASGSLDVASDAGNVSATLEGEGLAAAALAIDPTSYDFGGVLVGADATTSFMVSNIGDTTSSLDLSSIAVSGAGFSVTGGSCTATITLNGGDDCTAIVEFAPTAVGAANGTLTIESDAGDVSSTLEGEGLAAANLQITPTSEDFGSVLITETTTSSFSLSNTGDAVTSLTVNGISVAGDFNLVGGDCAVGTTLFGGESCSVEIQFAPQLVGPLTGVLEVDSSVGMASVSLDGIGLEGAQLAIDPADQIFGAVTVGDAVAASFTLTNTGDPASTLGITGIFTTGNSAFEVIGGSCVAGATSLDGQQTCTVDVSFAPGALGIAAGVLNVESDANNASAELAGEGTGPARISLDPTQFDFGVVRVGQPESATFTVANTGGAASSLAIGEIATVDSRFDVVGGGSCTTGNILASGDTCTVTVQFSPLVTGNYGGLLVIESSAGPVQAEVAGSGLNEVDLQISGTSDPQIPVVGTDVVYSLTVENLNAVGDGTGVMINSSQVPEGLELVSSSGCIEAPAVPNCTIGEIEAGGSASVVLRFAIPSDASDIISLAATVTADQQDPQPDNNLVEFSSVGGLGREADLFTNLQAVEFVPSSMTEVEFTLLFGNSGPSDVTGAAVGTDLGSILTGIEWTCEAQSGAVCEDPSGSGNVSSFVDLAVGTSVTFSVSASLTEPDKDQEGTSLSVIVEPEDVNDLDQSNNEAGFEVRTGIFADDFEASATP